MWSNRNEDGVAVLKVGQVRELKLNVQVNNLGEDAHKTTLAVLLPDKDSFSFIQASVRVDACYSIYVINSVVCYTTVLVKTKNSDLILYCLCDKPCCLSHYRIGKD